MNQLTRKGAWLLALVAVNLFACGIAQAADSFITLAEWQSGGPGPSFQTGETILIFKPDGSADVWIRKDKYTSGTATAADAKAMLDAIDAAGLFKFPAEHGPDAEDAYGLGAVLHVHQPGKCWQNGYPQTDVLQPARVAPDAAQKAAFRKLVDGIRTLAARTATKPADQAAFDAAAKTLPRD